MRALKYTHQCKHKLFIYSCLCLACVKLCGFSWIWIAIILQYTSNELVSLLMFVCLECERANACQWISPLPSPAVWEWVWHQIRRPLCSDAELSMACAPAPICVLLLTFHKCLISHAVRDSFTYRTRTHTEIQGANWINTHARNGLRWWSAACSCSSCHGKHHCFSITHSAHQFMCQSNRTPRLSTDDVAHFSNFLLVLAILLSALRPKAPLITSEIEPDCINITSTAYLNVKKHVQEADDFLLM